ncbi:hypothetical protein [Bacillus paramycoides]|uniref:hypothetical protein n=1 Tax=Bacillus paramycoides TaxID=2026194 RepID=UPI0038106D1D
MNGEFLASPFFFNFCLPLLTTSFIVFVKRVSKNDTNLKKYRVEDWALGIDVSVSSILIYAVESAKQYRISYKNPNIQYEMNNWTIVFLVVGLWIISHIIRTHGWKDNGELNRLGIIIPNIYGLIVLFSVFYIIGG